MIKKGYKKNSWLFERNCFEKCKVIMYILIKLYNGVFFDVENEIENYNKWKNLIIDIKNSGF